MTEEINVARNYGIRFCREGIRILEDEEDRLFDQFGHGFDRFSEEYLQLLKYRRMLTKFTQERDSGFQPSYDPAVHGSLEE